jgi:hypothetical protein
MAQGRAEGVSAITAREREFYRYFNPEGGFLDKVNSTKACSSHDTTLLVSPPHEHNATGNCLHSRPLSDGPQIAYSRPIYSWFLAVVLFDSIRIHKCTERE